jgi:intracellular sulfur oxidation DsrE/DsrF family protein
MKKSILLFALVIAVQLAKSQENYRVVFDMTSRDTINQQSLVRELALIRQANPNAKMEVVVYSQGLPIVVKDGSTQQAAVVNLLNDKDIKFKVCAMTMKRNNVDKSQLIPGVEVVPDGIYEIVTKQQEGWGYIKVSH